MITEMRFAFEIYKKQLLLKKRHEFNHKVPAIIYEEIYKGNI